MLKRHLRWLILIFVITLVAAYIDWPDNPGLHFQIAGIRVDRDFNIHEGLDLQGGMQVMLEADVPSTQPVTDDQMSAARKIVENRINGLGVAEPLIQLQGDRRMIVELPGIKDPEQAIKTFGQTGLLEFIDAGNTPLAIGQVVTTTLGGPTLQRTTTPNVAPPADATPAPAPTPAAAETPAAPAATPIVYTTIVEGKDLSSADVDLFGEGTGPEILFTFKEEGAKKFAEYTTNNVGKYLVITLDKQVISSPQIQSPITEGRGRITGRFTPDEARSLAIQLKYGSLPIPLKVIQNRTVGPTLGEDSVQRSIVAGIIGLTLVGLFMIIYYRLPGLLANLALLIYALIVFALFKLIPVTLTVAGIAGFVLSIGMAVDANILIFERMREELRLGKTLGAAVEAGFKRAWTSIRDSNVSTLITCVILFWFGMNFGASIIQGFALTLAIGVLVSMFTAIVVSRTFLRVLQSVWFAGVRPVEQERMNWLFGLYRTPAPAAAESPDAQRANA